MFLVQCGFMCQRHFLCSIRNVPCFLGHAVFCPSAIAECQMRSNTVSLHCNSLQCFIHPVTVSHSTTIHSIVPFIHALSVTVQQFTPLFHSSTHCQSQYNVTPAYRNARDCFHLCLLLFVIACSKLTLCLCVMMLYNLHPNPEDGGSTFV